MKLRIKQALVEALKQHQVEKENDPKYPTIPRTVVHNPELILKMDDKSLRHFTSCYSGFTNRVFNYKLAKSKVQWGII